ncbi:MAG: LemA family protein [Fusobacteria bacterium]|nr:LemA family protein [Fusobacteriota bacterium]
MWIAIAVVVVLFVIIIFGVGIYNSLIRNKVNVEEALSSIDVFLKKRYDLVPNLVETVKGYASHEKETLEKVVAARATAMNAGSMEAEQVANNQLSATLKTLFALSESYPDLKANTNFLDLQSQLSKLEDDISMSRKYYNGAVREYNTSIQKIPANIVAALAGFKQAEFFETEEESKTVPEVKF